MNKSLNFIFCLILILLFHSRLYAPVTITMPTPNETISLPFIATGTTTPGNTVDILIDGINTAIITADGSGNWSFTISSLSAGPHQLRAIVIGATEIVNFTVGVVCDQNVDILTKAIREKYGS